MPEHDGLSNSTPDRDRSTMFSFSEEGDDVVATVAHEESAEKTRAMAKAMLNRTPDLHEKILRRAADQGINPHIIDLPTPMSFTTDEQGHTCLIDTNNVIRYYPDTGEVYPTRDFIGTEKVDDSTQRVTDLQQMYETA